MICLFVINDVLIQLLNPVVYLSSETMTLCPYKIILSGYCPDMLSRYLLVCKALCTIYVIQLNLPEI